MRDTFHWAILKFMGSYLFAIKTKLQQVKEVVSYSVFLRGKRQKQFDFRVKYLKLTLFTHKSVHLTEE
mgnify:CR=1 FL=1